MLTKIASCRPRHHLRERYLYLARLPHQRRNSSAGVGALGHVRVADDCHGRVAGPKLKGQVVPGGWDFQLTYSASDCTQLSADYFLKADDGTLIHVFNEGLVCPGGQRSLFHPRLEAAKGAHEWLTHATFVATLEVEPGGQAVRIRFYQVK